MNYPPAVTDFFKSPKWVTNLLLAAVCCLIPVVGPMVVLGWLITGFWSRSDESPATFPDFDFNKFMPWLQRGLWPVLVAMVSAIAVYFVFLIPMMIIGGLLGGSDGGFLALITSLLLLVLQILMMLGFVFVVKPLMLKAIFEQDFVKAFDINFVKGFVSRTWLEMVISSIVLWVIAAVLFFAGALALCIGMLVVPPIIYFAAMHIDKQLYKLYLSRGGPPVTLSPSLTDPPVLSGPAA